MILQQANRTTSIANDLEHLDLDSIATSTVAIPHDLVPSNAMDVYKNYNFEHHSEGNLPIAEHKDEASLNKSFISIFMLICIKLLLYSCLPLKKPSIHSFYDAETFHRLAYFHLN